jgi:hypothetical protein
VEVQHDDANWGDPEPTPPTVSIEPASTTNPTSLLLPLGVQSSRSLLCLQAVRLMLWGRPPL